MLSQKDVHVQIRRAFDVPQTARGHDVQKLATKAQQVLRRHMILLGQRQGYIVEGQEMDKNHRLNPVNKDVLAKMIKTHKKNPNAKPRKLKRNRKSFSSDHVMPNTMNVSHKMPTGSYAS